MLESPNARPSGVELRNSVRGSRIASRPRGEWAADAPGGLLPFLILGAPRREATGPPQANALQTNAGPTESAGQLYLCRSLAPPASCRR